MENPLNHQPLPKNLFYRRTFRLLLDIPQRFPKLPNLPLKLFFTYHLLRPSDISSHLVFINCSNQELALHHTICTWTYLKGGGGFPDSPPPNESIPVIKAKTA